MQHASITRMLVLICQHLVAENVAQVKRKTETDKANDRLFNGLEVKVVEVSSINFLCANCNIYKVC